jgi:hypothetical protein
MSWADFKLIAMLVTPKCVQYIDLRTWRRRCYSSGAFPASANKNPALASADGRCMRDGMGVHTRCLSRFVFWRRLAMARLYMAERS